MSNEDGTERLQPDRALVDLHWQLIYPDTRLRLLRGSLELREQHPELYSEELDWYWNCYSSEVGLKSCSGIEVEYIFDATGSSRKGAEVTVNITGDPGGSALVDPWARPASLVSFALGRRVWAKLGRLPFDYREALRVYYEPRQWSELASEGCGIQPPDLAVVRVAHAAYSRSLDR